MDVIKHQELYCKLEFQLFVWDTSWEIWRPISAVGWNGSKITYDDHEYKKDIFDPWYGFGSSEMKELCKKLTAFIDRTKYTENIDKLFKYPEFLYDRKIGFLDICQLNLKTKESWRAYLNYLGTKNKTLRKFVDNRKTRRLLKRKLIKEKENEN
jgi:hypothetical protein